MLDVFRCEYFGLPRLNTSTRYRMGTGQLWGTCAA